MGGDGTIPLSEFVTLQRGFDLPSQERVVGHVPVVASTGVCGYHKEYKVKAPGVVIGRSGSIGGGQYITENYWPLNTTLWVKDFKNNDPRFVYYLLKTIDFESFNCGSGVPTLNRNHLSSVYVNILSLTEQKEISHILGSLDDKIELNRKMNQTLEAMAQALFKSWFVDFDPVIDNALVAGNPIPDEFAERAEIRRQAIANGTANREVAKDFPAGFRLTEEMGWVPEGWETQPLYNVANFINGASYKESDFTDDLTGFPVVKIAEIKNGISGQTKFTHVIKGQKYNIDDGEILLSWSGNPDTSIDTFLWTNGRGCLNQHIFKVSLKEEEDRYFVYYQLKFLRSAFAEIARDKQTTGLGHFTAADMKRIFVFKPENKILGAFNVAVAPLYQRNYVNLITQKSVCKIRDILLPKLISGDLEIKSNLT